MIRDENSFASKLYATANECTHNDLDKDNKDNDIKLTNYDNWLQPKKCIPITCFFKQTKRGNKSAIEENNNKHSILMCDYENEDEEDCEIKDNTSKLKMMEGNINNKNKNQRKKSKKQGVTLNQEN